MTKNQEYWERLQKRYEEQTRSLMAREAELRYKLEAMDAIIGDGSKNEQGQPVPQLQPQRLPQSMWPPHPPPAPPPRQTIAVSTTIQPCSCQEEKEGGLFKCIMSMLPFKGKPATPPPPPPVTQSPTRAPSGPQMPQGLKNENCQCSPCVVDTDVFPQKEESICNCSIIETAQFQKRPSKVSGDSSICTCSICSQFSDTANVDVKKTYPCSPKELISDLKKDNDSCRCSVCDKSSLCRCNEDSKLSLNSLDLYYMKNIHDMVSQQKSLMNSVNDLEKKTKIYEQVLNEYKDVSFIPKDPKIDEEAINKSNAELKLENFLLKNELKDMRLDVRQYLEKMEGPMQFKIESERYKNIQLEEKLAQASKELKSVQESSQREVNLMKMELFQINTNVSKLTEANEKAMEEVELYKAKCSDLEDQLVRQKISEGETLKAMQAALNAQRGAEPEKEECNLHLIARELSSILKECEPCGNCMNLPEDLTAAAKLLKSLTDMIDQKLGKGDDAKGEGETVVSPQEDDDDDMDSIKDILCKCGICPEAGAADAAAPAAAAEPTEGGAPAEGAPAEGAPAECAPAEGAPAEGAPEKTSSVESVPTDGTRKRRSCKCNEPKKPAGPSSSSKKSCKCITKPQEQKEFSPASSCPDPTAKALCTCGKKSEGAAKGSAPPSDKVDQLWPTGPKQTQTSVKQLKIQDNFPFNVDTHVDIIDKEPDGVHITTTVTKSGMLEVVTEGPDGFIETTLVYTQSGNVEVVTEILDYETSGKKSCNRGRINAGGMKAIEAPPGMSPTCPCSPCVPAQKHEAEAAASKGCQCKVSQTQTPANQEAIAGQKASCKCASDEEEVVGGDDDSKSDSDGLPDECKCGVCPQAEEESPDDAEAGQKTGGCKCETCPR